MTPRMVHPRSDCDLRLQQRYRMPRIGKTYIYIYVRKNFAGLARYNKHVHGTLTSLQYVPVQCVFCLKYVEKVISGQRIRECHESLLMSLWRITAE